MKRFGAREVNWYGQRAWVVWDTRRDSPADGAYGSRVMAQAAAGAVNALIRRGGDPYRDWLWNDGRVGWCWRGILSKGEPA